MIGRPEKASQKGTRYEKSENEYSQNIENQQAACA